MPRTLSPDSFRNQLALACGLGVMLLCALLSCVVGALAARAAARDQSDALHTLARGTARALADDLHERLRDIELLAQIGLPLDTPTWMPVLQQVRQSRREYAWLGITGPDGTVLAASGELPAGPQVGRRPWFQAALAGPHVGDARTGTRPARGAAVPAGGETPRLVVDLAAPVRDAGGRVQAVLAAQAQWDWAGDAASLRSPLAREQGVQVFIFDRHGEPIHRPPGAPGVPRPAALERLSAGTPAVVAWADGPSYLTAAAVLPLRGGGADRGWTVVTRQPEDRVTEAAAAARNGTLLAGAVAAVLASALAWLGAGRLTRPLSRMAEAARQVQQGRLDVPFPALEGACEVRTLAHALSDMTDALRRGERERAETHAALERKVHERSTELKSAAHALQQAHAELELLAGRDALTGLLNRRSLDAALQREVSRHRRSDLPLSVVRADIDRFEVISEAHGHATGDEVLAAVAQMLARTSRSTDVVGRHGGAAFVILMPDTSLEGALVACEKLRDAVQRMDGPVPVTLSLGVVSPAQLFSLPEQALDAAGQALAEARALGRGVRAYQGPMPDRWSGSAPTVPAEAVDTTGWW